MAKRTIYVREEDEAVFDKLAGAGNLSALIARAVKADLQSGESSSEPSGGAAEVYSEGHRFEFSVEPQGSKKKPESLVSLMQVDPLTVEVGRGLLSLVDPARGSPLLELITPLRRQIALTWGVTLPGIRFRDDLKISATAYVIRFRDVKVGGGELVLKGGAEPTGGVGDHLRQVVQAHLAELLALEEARALIDTIRKSHPTVVDAVIPSRLSLVQLWQLLRGLLREQVSIRDLPAILESILLGQEVPFSLDSSLESARLAIRRQIYSQYTDKDGVLAHLALDPGLEASLRRGPSEESRSAILEEAQRHAQADSRLVLVTAPDLRALVRDVLLPVLPSAAVLSSKEVAGVNLRSVGRIAVAAPS